MADLATEKTIVQKTADEIQALGEQLAEAHPERTKQLQRQLDEKLAVYSQQLQVFQAQFPSSDDARIYEASLYGYQAISRFHQVGLVRSASKLLATGTGKAVRSNMAGGIMGLSLKVSAGVIGGALTLGTSLVAKQQEKANAREALALLDKAIAVIDLAGPHYTKAHIYAALGENETAIRELDYIITNFPGDPAYTEARQMKDELLTPKKKKWF